MISIIGMFIFSIFSFCFSKVLSPLKLINFSSLFSIFFAFSTSSLYNNITSLLVLEIGFFCIEIFPFLLSCILSISVRIFLSNCFISSSSFLVSTIFNSNNSICFSISTSFLPKFAITPLILESLLSSILNYY